MISYHGTNSQCNTLQTSDQREPWCYKSDVASDVALLSIVECSNKLSVHWQNGCHFSKLCIQTKIVNWCL